jgi:hypothetical protein
MNNEKLESCPICGCETALTENSVVVCKNSKYCIYRMDKSCHSFIYEALAHYRSLKLRERVENDRQCVKK